MTRFPPEPNGYLHIGHAKAMFIDFGLAQKRGGKCILRFDDTNPEAAKGEYIEHIKEVAHWMGWDYCKVTHSSDYFDELHAFAVQLIKAGKAYVCHQTGEEIKEAREQRLPSPWRERPMAESLRLFEDMRRCLPPSPSFNGPGSCMHTQACAEYLLTELQARSTIPCTSLHPVLWMRVPRCRPLPFTYACMLQGPGR